MEVLLLRDVKNLGKQGDVVKVKDGYGRNYLIPRGLAKRIDKGVIAQRDEAIRIMSAKEKRERQIAQEIRKDIESKPIVINVKVGESGKLYGSVTAKHIADEIERVFNRKIDKKRICLDEPIRKTGRYKVTVKLGHGIEATIEVMVEEQ